MNAALAAHGLAAVLAVCAYADHGLAATPAAYMLAVCALPVRWLPLHAVLAAHELAAV